jgi:hypothetical protein
VSTPLNSLASGTTEAADMVEKFISRYDRIKRYETVIQKKEWDPDGNSLHNEKINLSHEKPNKTIVKYLDKGYSGIRNNGMTITYGGGQDVYIQLGSANVFGLLTHGVASLVVPDKLSLFDSKVLDDEIITINRGGIGYFCFTLKKFLSQIKSAKKGGFSLMDGLKNHVKYSPITDTANPFMEVELRVLWQRFIAPSHRSSSKS